MSERDDLNWKELPRGGYLVKTSYGPVQFGAPPETIKDTMVSADGVPSVFLLPRKLFYVDRGISTAELEFPIYYNFFVKQRKIQILCTRDQKRRISRVIQEAIFGPENLDLRYEYYGGERFHAYPNLKKEMDFFRANPFKKGALLELEDFVIFRTFSRGKIELDGVQVESEHRGFLIRDQGKVVARLPENIQTRPIRDVVDVAAEPFGPPAFGLTAIGSGHGFLPGAKTSGFILWVNRRGILIDPPVDSTDWLEDNEINTKIVDSIILTHCHADHDAGTLQKVLEEGRVVIFSTRTILSSFMRKYAALTGLTENELARLCNMKPILIGEPLRIHGAEFHFRHTLHSIPTIGFDAYYQGRSISYSSDTLYCPKTVQHLFDQGWMSHGRRDELVNFPSHHDLVIHEAGMPPLHTGIEALENLPPEKQKNLHVTHLNPDDLRPDSKLVPILAGVEKSLILEVTPNPHSEAIEILNLMASCDLFQGFPADKAGEFLNIAEPVSYQAGDIVIAAGDPGEYFYLVVAGKAVIVANGEEVKVCGFNDYFGESALVTDLPRTATVHAKTDLRAVRIQKHDFLYFIRGSEIGLLLRNLFVNRSLQVWRVFEESRMFRSLSAAQKTRLLSMFTTETIFAKAYLLEKGRRPEKAAILISGEAEVTDGKERIATLRRGDFAGQVFTHRRRRIAAYTIRALNALEVLVIKMDDFSKFLDANPGFHLRLVNLDYSKFI